MKLFSRTAVFSVSLALFACNAKDEKTSTHHDQADAAIQADDSSCSMTHAESMGIHGDLTGYTESATGGFHVKVEWSSPLKASSLENKATVTFVNEHAEPLPLKLTVFKLFMPAMGHGSGKTDQLVLTQDASQTHVWSVDKVYFSMGGGAGEWVVDIEASGCGVSDKARVIIEAPVQ